MCRKDRSKALSELKPEMFENYRDFFMALHLNPATGVMHLIGALVGLALLPIALITMQWWIFVVYFFFFYGFGFLSHLIFDGLVSRTAGEAPWGSFIYALEVNLIILLGRFKGFRQEMFEKYPFLTGIYS